MLNEFNASSSFYYVTSQRGDSGMNYRRIINIIGGTIPSPIITLQDHSYEIPLSNQPIINPDRMPKLLTISVLLTKAPLILVGISSAKSKGPIMIPIPTPIPVKILPISKLLNSVALAYKKVPTMKKQDDTNIDFFLPHLSAIQPQI